MESTLEEAQRKPVNSTTKVWSFTDDNGDHVATEYDRLGRTSSITDQRGAVHDYTFDTAGRLSADTVTDLGESGIVDDAVLRIGRTYDDMGRLQFVTSYSDTSGTSVVNQVKYEYDGWGLVYREYQEHDATVDANTPFVQYNYEDGATGGVAQYVRLDAVVYPDANRTVDYDYGTVGATDDIMSRLAAIGDGATTFASYRYLGARRIITEDYEDIEVKLDHAANNFAALDRFGRVVDQAWTDYGANPDTVLDEYTYEYDRAGNRTAKTNELNHDFDETYAYDSLDRLVSAERDSGFDQSWTLDGLGNFSGFDDDGSSQTRTANAVNEITGITGGWVSTAYDAAGNMVSGPKPGNGSTRVHYLYDAWNRLVIVKADDSGDPSDTLAEYQYDGTNRRIQKVVTEDGGGPSEAHYFYNPSWQLLEERFVDGQGATVASNQYVWSPRYIDALIVRFHDSNGDGDYLDAGDNIRYYTSDANFNVTATIDAGSGDVAERYVYTAYGTVTVYSAGWTNPAAPANDGPLYCGYFFDAETALYQVRNRHYDSRLSIFISRDPISYRGGLDLYAYCADAPLGRIDPAGLEWHHWFPEGNGIPQKISQLCGGKLDISQYTTWIDGSTTLPGTGHYWIHITQSYNQKVLDLLNRANGDCCAFLMDMQELIYNMWAQLYQQLGRLAPPLSTRPYPGDYPGPRPSTLDDLMHGDTYKKICEDPCRKVRPPMPLPKPVPLPWWVPADPNNDIYQDIGISIGIGVIVIGGWWIGGPMIGGGAVGGGAGGAGGTGAGTVILPIAA